MGSLQPSRATEFLADLGQGGGRAAAEPEAALRGLPPAAGGGPERGADAWLGAPSPAAPGREARDLRAQPQPGSLLRGGGAVLAPRDAGGLPPRTPGSSPRRLPAFPGGAAAARPTTPRAHLSASCESVVSPLGPSRRPGSTTLGFVWFIFLPYFVFVDYVMVKWS